MITNTPRNGILSAMLELSVPFKIHELALAGGPSQRDYDRLKQFSDDFHGREEYSEAQAIVVTGDAQGCTKKQHRVNAEFMNEMIFAAAVMAFQPGGIEIFGARFDAGRPDITGSRGQIRGVLPATHKLLEEL